MTNPPRQISTRPAWLRFRVGYVVILAVVVLFSVKFAQQTWHDDQKGRQLALAQAQYAAQLRETSRLGKQIVQYKTLAFVRQQARAWGYVKKGDQPVLISYQHPKTAHRRMTLTPKPARRQPVWRQWWQAFFGGRRH
jgi:type II secretory pathway component PulL